MIYFLNDYFNIVSASNTKKYDTKFCICFLVDKNLYLYDHSLCLNERQSKDKRTRCICVVLCQKFYSFLLIFFIFLKIDSIFSKDLLSF